MENTSKSKDIFAKSVKNISVTAAEHLGLFTAMINKCLSLVSSYSEKSLLVYLVWMGCCFKSQSFNPSYSLQKTATHLVEGHSKRTGVLPNLYPKEELFGFHTDLLGFKKTKL